MADDVRYPSGSWTPDDGLDAREPLVTLTPSELLDKIWRQPPGDRPDPRAGGRWRAA